MKAVLMELVNVSLIQCRSLKGLENISILQEERNRFFFCEALGR
jgi:hypothetical protein